MDITSRPVNFILALVVVICALGPGCTRQEEILVARDGLAQAGSEVRLSARLMRTGLLAMREPGVAGEVVRISVDGVRTGEGLTDVQGVFSCRIQPRDAGTFSFTASLVSTRRCFATDVGGLVAILARDRPVLLVEVDRLFAASDKPPLEIPFLDRLRGPGVQFKAATPPHLALGADAALERLAQYYSLAYIAILGEAHKRDLRQWIETMDCPSAPVLVWEVGLSSDSEKALERRRERGLRRLITEIEGPVVGIVGSEEAARQYSDQGLLAVHLDLQGEEGDEEEEEDGLVRLTKWKETGALLSGESFRDPSNLRRRPVDPS